MSNSPTNRDVKRNHQGWLIEEILGDQTTLDSQLRRSVMGLTLDGINERNTADKIPAHFLRTVDVK